MVIEEQERWTLGDIMALFDGVFAAHYQTRLIKGGDEPLYRPATDQTPVSYTHLTLPTKRIV